MKIEGQIIDLFKREIFDGIVFLKDGKIDKIERSREKYDRYIIPGLIDSHIHIESSMVTPGAFAMSAVSRGTTGVVADPHEIANVLGIAGVNFMISDAGKVPLKFYFGAPSCVPATGFETSGAELGSNEIGQLLERKEIKLLAEMMNFPGVIYDDPEVMRKIEKARKAGKKIDGHAPGLTGKDLEKYINTGISTDHECSSIEEAREKIKLGMKVLIREGSAARNLDALKELFNSRPEMIMLCSDDLHPEMLMKRHINKITGKLIGEGFDIYDVIRSCTVNPDEHYALGAGLLRPGDPADLIVVDDLKKMNIIETWINGEKVYSRGKIRFNYNGAEHTNNFHCSRITKDQISVKRISPKIRVIKAFDGQLLTKELIEFTSEGKTVESDTARDILKIVVKDRYKDNPPATGFINGFGLKTGAFASSVAHDSHNIICIGTNDNDILEAINEIVRIKGGLAVACCGKTDSLPLPVGGIMSDRPVSEIAEAYEKLSSKTREMGCMMTAPFMSLSFMALLVIPELKLSDRGIFDGRSFKQVSLFTD